MSSCAARLSLTDALSVPEFVVFACTCIVLSTLLGYVLASTRSNVSQPYALVSDLLIYPIKGCGGIRVASAEVTPRGLANDRMLMIVRGLDGAMQTQRQLPRMATIRPFWNESGHLVLTAPNSPDFVLSADGTDDDAHRRPARVWKHEMSDAIDCGDDVASWLCAALSTPELRLVRMPYNHRRRIENDPDEEHIVSFADGYPLLLVSDTSREAVRKLAELPVLAMERFRPNIVVQGDKLSAFEENQWAEISVGDVLFKSPKPCERCQVPRIDPSTGTPNSLPDGQPTTALKSLTNNCFGVNLVPITSGAHTVRIGDGVRLNGRGS